MALRPAAHLPTVECNHCHHVVLRRPANPPPVPARSRSRVGVVGAGVLAACGIAAVAVAGRGKAAPAVVASTHTTVVASTSTSTSTSTSVSVHVETPHPPAHERSGATSRQPQPDGTLRARFGQIAAPGVVAIDPRGRIFVADGSRLAVVEPDGKRAATLDVPTFVHFAIDTSGFIYLLSADRVTKLSITL